ncbi:cell wall-active antibiotics response protein LiaF [Streptococcus himalayensis]|uniref:Transporter n=1 Tax=Streptococcus himalayensis TaxID=1888195 RepID=A0A917EDU4_9STRE|nr:cell wall-active antibiotics response protein LiaF [Streptococcus himalayensis]GGE28827.1 transporter [Streptococcus himalayensis]
MRKLQFFLLVEAILLSLALVTILSGHFSRLLLFLVLFLLFVYYYFGKQKTNVLLVGSSLLLFFAMMLNPFVIAAMLFALVYGMIVAAPYLYKEDTTTDLVFEDTLGKKTEKNRWLGNLHHFAEQKQCRFDDINLFRFAGQDTIHLEKIIVAQHDNVIILRKIAGNTKIILPVDVGVRLNVNHLYGELTFLDQPVYDLRNENLTLTTPDFETANKTVKIVLATFVGNVEVVRR